MHDLVPLRYPEWVTEKTRTMHGAKYANTARTCDVIFVNSEFTGRDVVDRLGVAPDRVKVAYPGVKEVFRPDGERADLGRPYVLTVATLEPRKNLAALVEAHRLLEDDVLLAVVGGSGWGDQAELRGANVVRLGFVSDEELARLYRGAAVAVYPSRFEGFGMPITEAMACGVPVVASAHESMDEAAGPAAVRADPDDPAAIAAAIREAHARRDALVRPRPVARRSVHLARVRRGLPRRLRGGGGAVKVGVDVSPLVQTRAGTARHVNGLLGALAGRDVDVTPLAFGGTGRAATVAARHLVVLPRPAAVGPRPRRPPLHDLPRPAARAGSVHGDAARSRAGAPPRALPALAPATPAAPGSAASRARPIAFSPSPSSRSGRRWSCSVCRPSA